MYFRRTSQTKASLQNKSQIDSTRPVSTNQPAGRCFPRRTHSPPNLRVSAPAGDPGSSRGGCRGNTSPNPDDPFPPRPRTSISPAHFSGVPLILHPKLGRGSGKGGGGRTSPTPLRLHGGNLISLLERQAGGRPTRCLYCCNIIESAPLGRATRRPSARPPGWGRGGASRRSRKGRGGGARAARVGGGGCNHLPPPRPGQPSSAGGGAGDPLLRGGGEQRGGGEAVEPGARPWEARRGGRRPEGCSPALPAVSLARREGGGERDKKPNLAAPAGDPPAHRSRRQHLPRGRSAAPLAPSPAAAKFSLRLRSVDSSPRAPRLPCSPPAARS